MRTIVLASLCLTSFLHAQTAPATTQAHRVVVPGGFERIIESGHTVLAEPADRPWVETALRQLIPATKPSTQPSDLAANLAAHRDAVRSQMIALLTVQDAATVDRFLDDTLRPLIERYTQLRPPLVFMATSQARLKQVMLDGWSDPRLHYNRAADAVDVSRGVRLSIDGPSDENLLPVIYAESSDSEKRKADLTAAVRALDFQIAVQIANRAQADVQLSFIAFMAREVFEPLQLKPDQVWFSMGASGVLSSHFAEPLDGIASTEFVGGLSRDRRDNPFHNTDIHLLHPTPMSELRAAAVPAYSDAYQRKSIRLVAQLTERAGVETLPKIIAAIREQRPADGAALLKIVQQSSGVDLNDAVTPGH